MKYFLDTEFWESGAGRPIQLISVGLVSADGTELYEENVNVNEMELSPWLRENVVPHLKNDAPLFPWEIASKIQEFVGDDSTPVFWADYAAYDWVVFCQLFGSMIALPKGWPMFCRDFQQLLEFLSVSAPKVKVDGAEHNALADAKKLKAQFEALRVSL